ncbi:DUF4129 domain-containing protein [Haloarcula nitratireducens]|uniref:DUF4129 domain-containing protein n=1 Tax=Haloarcula nitratireducens TaxID=2487749 RepID=A0AAW4PCI4_9EURY|nr:DUF4129 domain-containing protein [Halomicroarcula nitratireducens]MBX0294987.1 DUF4129 domain-containing protein [Halomicroarcula nitratireducens]
MNTERVVSVGIAVAVVVALTFSASTLGSSMETDPSDAIDVEYEALPLGDSGDDVEEAAQRLHDQYDQQASQSQSQSQSQSSSSSSSSSSQSQQSSSASAQPDPASQSDLVELLVALLVLALLVGVAYYYRERLRALFGRLVDESDDEAGGERAIPVPENDVQRAWVELVTRAGVRRPRMRTPRDCARAAVETGFDADAVHRLRRAFEDVQYGGAPPTEERERNARETLRTLAGGRLESDGGRSTGDDRRPERDGERGEGDGR